MDRQQSEGAYVTERGPHDDGPVSVLLVVIVNRGDGPNTRVFIVLVSRSGLVLLVPVQNATDEGRDEGDTGFGTSNSLPETEQEGEVTVDLVVTLEFASSLDTLPAGSNLDENTFLGDPNRLVELDQVLGLYQGTAHVRNPSERKIGA